MDNVLPTVTIGCPVSNRDYLINRYLDGIYNLDYPRDKIKLYFLVNNCTDNTENELKLFQRKFLKEYQDIEVERYRMSFRKDKRITGYRYETYKRLSELRNYVLSKIETDYFFSVDSDIILNYNVLKGLVNCKKHIVAAIINNDKILRPYYDYPNIRTNILIDGERGITHYLDYPKNELIEVKYTGAVYLLSKEVCKNLKYSFHEQGEDIGFCNDARDKGYKLYCHTTFMQNHIMCEYQEYCINNNCHNPCVSINNQEKVYQYKYKDNIVYPNLIRCSKLIKGNRPLLNN